MRKSAKMLKEMRAAILRTPGLVTFGKSWSELRRDGIRRVRVQVYTRMRLPGDLTPVISVDDALKRLKEEAAAVGAEVTITESGAVYLTAFIPEVNNT